MKKLINKLKEKKLKKDLKKMEVEAQEAQQELEDSFEFVWGILSGDDLSNSQEANLYTMNDFDIVFNKTERQYYGSIETIYGFPNGIKGTIAYLKNILSLFEKWLKENNYNIYITNPCDIYEPIDPDYHLVFQGWNSFDKTPYDSIEELYFHFKVLVKGYEALLKENKKEETEEELRKEDIKEKQIELKNIQ